MKKTQMLIMAAAIFSLNGFLSAGESLDIKGGFGPELKDGFPVGWLPNKPWTWDDAGTVVLNQVEGTEKYALQVTSQTKEMYLYFEKQWPIAAGDRCVVRAMVRGKGTGKLGVFYYFQDAPGNGMFKKEFQATEEWTEFVAEATMPKVNPAIEKIRVTITVSPGASIEFSDVTAEIIKKQ